MDRLWQRAGTLAVVGLLALGVFACGGGDDDDSSPSGDDGTRTSEGSTGGGEWKGKFETGTELSAKLFVPATDPAVAKYEELRKAAGAPPVVYARLVAKNTGKVADTARFLTLTDKEGEALEDGAVIMDFACLHASRWSQTPNLPPAAIAAYTSLYNIDCRGASLAGPSINAGETFTYFVAVETATEPAFERVFVGASAELKK